MSILPPAADDAQPPRPFRETYGSPEQKARERMAARRARVLAHPEIAKRLTWPPMNYPAPEFWTGYIPPAVIEKGPGPSANTSPIRRQLLAICQAVADLEAAQQEEEATG